MTWQNTKQIENCQVVSEQYYASFGYRVIREDRPNALSFTRGSWFFSRAIFSGEKRNLAVSIMPKDDEVAIRCTYKMPAFLIEGADEAELRLEVEGRSMAAEVLVKHKSGWLCKVNVPLLLYWYD